MREFVGGIVLIFTGMAAGFLIGSAYEKYRRKYVALPVEEEKKDISKEPEKPTPAEEKKEKSADILEATKIVASESYDYSAKSRLGAKPDISEVYDSTFNKNANAPYEISQYEVGESDAADNMYELTDLYLYKNHVATDTGNRVRDDIDEIIGWGLIDKLSKEKNEFFVRNDDTKGDYHLMVVDDNFEEIDPF